MSLRSDPDRAWMAEGACVDEDPAIFFPIVARGQHHMYDEARRLCDSCPVREACLAYALTHDEAWGVWGGLTAEERRALRRVSLRLVPCVVCGERFQSRNSHHRYCSTRCHLASRWSRSTKEKMMAVSPRWWELRPDTHGVHVPVPRRS